DRSRARRRRLLRIGGGLALLPLLQQQIAEAAGGQGFLCASELLLAGEGADQDAVPELVAHGAGFDLDVLPEQDDLRPDTVGIGRLAEGAGLQKVLRLTGTGDQRRR